jgi:hypothetical protein
MGADFKHVGTGDPLAIRADTWNALLDAAKLDRDTRGGLTGGAGTLSLGDVSPALTILVENQTGANLPFGGVVRLDIEAYTLDLNFRSRPVYRARRPSGNATDILVAVAEPIYGNASGNVANGTGNGIGRAVLIGHAVANISVSNTTHRFANANANNANQWFSNATWGFPILGNISGTGNLTLGLFVGEEPVAPSTWLRVTGDISNGTYPAVVTTIAAGNQLYVDGSTTVRIRGGNNETLVIGERYLGCISLGLTNATSGNASNSTLYVVNAGIPDANNTRPGRVNLLDQYLGAGNKTVDKIVASNGNTTIQPFTLWDNTRASGSFVGGVKISANGTTGLGGLSLLANYSGDIPGGGTTVDFNGVYIQHASGNMYVGGIANRFYISSTSVDPYGGYGIRMSNGTFYNGMWQQFISPTSNDALYRLNCSGGILSSIALDDAPSVISQDITFQDNFGVTRTLKVRHGYVTGWT